MATSSGVLTQSRVDDPTPSSRRPGQAPGPAVMAVEAGLGDQDFDGPVRPWGIVVTATLADPSDQRHAVVRANALDAITSEITARVVMTTEPTTICGSSTGR